VPTYGYKCQRCEREFDVWQKMTDEPVASCPVCGGAGRRLFFPAGIVFKGAGFYATDSRAAKPASNGSSTSSSSSTETSTPKNDTGSSTGSGTTAASTSSD